MDQVPFNKRLQKAISCVARSIPSLPRRLPVAETETGLGIARHVQALEERRMFNANQEKWHSTTTVYRRELIRDLKQKTDTKQVWEYLWRETSPHLAGYDSWKRAGGGILWDEVISHAQTAHQNALPVY